MVAAGSVASGRVLVSTPMSSGHRAVLGFYPGHNCSRRVRATCWFPLKLITAWIAPSDRFIRACRWDDFKNDPQLVKNSVRNRHPTRRSTTRMNIRTTGYKWGMSIDLTTCIGCNACLVACEAENNIPVVGKGPGQPEPGDVLDSRRYVLQRAARQSEFHHMPVPCMHCEHAPCELVCPVEATVHDHEGLNLQVYNRCVGTRFCSNNCPYKVRRFNFLSVHGLQHAESQADVQSRCDRALARGDGEMHLLHPAHQPPRASRPKRKIAAFEKAKSRPRASRRARRRRLFSATSIRPTARWPT